MLQELFAIFPRQTERLNVRNAKTRDDSPQNDHVFVGELSFHNDVLRPVHQLLEREFVMKISSDPIGYRLLTNQHGPILHFLMTLIHRVFFVDLDQVVVVVIDLLPEAQCSLLRVDFFQITCSPAKPTNYVELAPSASGQLIPVAKLFLVLRPGAHSSSLSVPRPMRYLMS